MTARVKLVGLMVFAVFAVFAVMASSASALQWLLDGKPIEKPVGVSSSGALQLADLAATGGATEIVCEGSGTGTIGPLAHDEVKTLTAEKCRFVSGKNGSCEASDAVTAKAVNLPYLTLLITVGAGVTEDLISPGARGGNPGWSVECTVLGVFRAQDECTAPDARTLVVNLAGGVDTIFQESETASCTLGNATSGMAFGTGLNKNPTGHTISVSNSPNQ
jgi:hypothetical protein